MDSTGVPDRIQVSASTATVHSIHVKGLCHPDARRFLLQTTQSSQLKFLFRFRGEVTVSQGRHLRVLANRVGSDLQYLGQSPGPMLNLYCAQKELVGQASL